MKKDLRRQRKDIDKARGRLIGWATSSAAGIVGIGRIIDELETAVAQRSGRTQSEVRAALSHEPFTMLTHSLAMFIWLTGDDNADPSSVPLTHYMSERGWRESSTGRRWLQQVSASRFELREVIDVSPDRWVRLTASSEKSKPVTVHEPRLANDETLGLLLYGRVLPMPAGAVVADGLLLVERDIVAALPSLYRAHDVFAIWTSSALLAEGLFSSDSLLPNDQQPGFGQSSPAAEELPRSSGRFDDVKGDASPEKPVGTTQASTEEHLDAESREKLLARVRKLFAMAQETEASPHEAEIALRRCQSLMARFGISEKDLETSEFGRENAYRGKRVPMHIQFLSIAVARLHGVIFVSGGGEMAHFRGFEIDVRVARLTLDYLMDAVERALAARRRTGEFPPGRMAAYDYRLAFADEVIMRVTTIVSEREAEERASSHTGTALTLRKKEIVERECGQDLRTVAVRGRGTIDDEAAGAGREDGARVSLNSQVGGGEAPRLLGRD